MSIEYSDKCPIWETPAIVDDKSELGESSAIGSPRSGGKFAIDEEGLFCLRKNLLSLLAKVNLSRWIWNQIDTGVEQPLVDRKLIVECGTYPSPNVVVRLDEAMKWFGRRQKSIAESLNLQNISWNGANPADRKGFLFLDFLAATSCASVDEGEKLIEFLIEKKFLKRHPGNQTTTVTPIGWDEIVRLSNRTGLGEQAFVAMWFHEEMKGVFEQAIEPAVVAAGYRPVIINKKEHNNQIVDEIIAEIRKSKFVIADFTCGTFESIEKDVSGSHILKEVPRGGVYFEAGFAKGLGREVIWTVRRDRLQYLHFDTKQYNFIDWKDVNDLKLRLMARIVATLGEGPLKKQLS